MILFLLLACPGTSDDTGKTAAFDGNFVFTDANNYGYTSAVDGSSTEIQLATDFTVDWSGLTTDLLGHPIDPATEVDYIWIVNFPNLTEVEVETAIATDALLQEDIGAYIQFRNEADATSATLSQFVFPPATPIVPEEDFTDGSGTWLVRATTGLVESRMIAFMVPTDATTNTLFELGSDAATLAFDADLQSLDAFAVDEELETYTADWSALETHANGNEINLDLIDQIMIARYDSMSLDDIEADFIDVEVIASEIYTADVYGLTSVDLSVATDTGGAAFSGFGTDSLWLIALRCTDCTNPAPPFLTVVDVGG